jgi:trans-aconitate methyltransferase
MEREMPMAIDWEPYYAGSASRGVRALCTEALGLAGPGAGRFAIDLGCGAGLEAGAMLRAGWRVLALDGSPGTVARVEAVVAPAARGALAVAQAPFQELRPLPAAELLYSGYALPFQPPVDFGRTWELVRAALKPGAWLAVNFFGDRDTWAAEPDMTCHTAPQVRELLDGLDVVVLREEERDGTALSGPKHWHVFDVVARAWQ